MQKIVKYFESLVNRSLFKVNKILFKLTNIDKENTRISILNKFLISFIVLLFFYLFYLSLPTLYNKVWVQNTLEQKLKKEFNLNFSVSSEISYKILPSPHFLINNSRITSSDIETSETLADIKNLKIFIKQNNFFNKEKIYIKKILIDNTNFSFKANNFKVFSHAITKKLSNKKVNITNSNFFLKNNVNETVAIIKIPKALFFYDNLKLLNIIDLKGEIFNLPFKMSLNQETSLSKKNKINIYYKTLKLNIFNESVKNTKNITTGINIIEIINSKIFTVYDIKNNLITFKSQNSKIKNSNLNYRGKLSTEPFDFNLDMNLKNYEIKKLLNLNSFIVNILKTELLFNENISSKISLNTTYLKKDEIFDMAKINFHIANGTINFNNTKLINDKIGTLRIVDSLLFVDKDKLTFNCDIVIDIKNSNNLFSFLQTPKINQKLIEKININLDYDFSSNEIYFNSFKINGNKKNMEMIGIINAFYKNKNNNLNKSKRFINKLISLYEG